MNALANQTIITNLSYETTNQIIEEFKKIFIASGKKVNQESELLTPMIWQVVLKNKARVFVQFKIIVNSTTNHTLKIKLAVPMVLSERKKDELEKAINAVVDAIQREVKN